MTTELLASNDPATSVLPPIDQVDERAVTAMTTRARGLTDIATEINDDVRRINEALTFTLERSKHVGELLLLAKDRLPHGEWLPWLDANCDVSRRQAENYMRLARDWDKLIAAANSKRVANLDELPMRRALRLLVGDKEEPTPPTEWPRKDLDSKTDYRCPECQHEWIGDPKPKLKSAGGRARS